MTAIQPVENELNKLINREYYRKTLASISSKYEEMQTYMDNLAQDIASIDEFVETLDRDMSQGFDVGTSKQTLLFQRSTLQIDLSFYTDMKKTYLRKIYEDLFRFCKGIIDAAVEIEPNPLKQDIREIALQKFAGTRQYEEGSDYTMSEIYNLLSVTERNLFELSSDIASFSNKINDAKQKQDRGFAIGNLLVNLESQKTKLTLEFKGYITRIKQFLDQNDRFSGRCLGRVKLISNEIVTDAELAKQQEEEEAETPSSEASENSPDNA